MDRSISFHLKGDMERINMADSPLKYPTEQEKKMGPSAEFGKNVKSGTQAYRPNRDYLKRTISIHINTFR